ncbi:hypothetical protein [Cetobacterium sp. SF1]|uniref:hypothetical protein n=1 Tax=unclassified Cetobacterium TaxID=2630983 RepID=UPI003CF9730F
MTINIDNVFRIQNDGLQWILQTNSNLIWTDIGYYSSIQSVLLRLIELKSLERAEYSNLTEYFSHLENLISDLSKQVRDQGIVELVDIQNMFQQSLY